MKLENNLETVIGRIDSLMSQVRPTHPDYDSYKRAANMAVKALKAFQTLKTKKQRKYLFKKEIAEKKDLKNDSN